MSDDCKTNEACTDEPKQFTFTGEIIYDGEDLACEAEPLLDTTTGSKLNVMITNIWARLCDLFSRVDAVETQITTIINEGIGDGVVTNVELVGQDLVFTGVDGGFNGTIPLSSLVGANNVDYINGANLVGNILNLTGIGNAGASIDLTPILTGIVDTNDIDYINGGNISGTNLVLTGIGNAGVTVDLEPIITQAVSLASGSGGTNDDDIIGRYVTFGSDSGVVGPEIVWTNGGSGSKILTLNITSWTQTIPDTTNYVTINTFGGTYVLSNLDWAASDGNVLILINAPTTAEGNRYLNGAGGLTITSDVVANAGQDIVTFSLYGYDY